MLKLLDTAETFNSFRNTKCAEVYCQNEEMHFSIVCIYCEMKTFGFGDFLLHFKNVHLQKSDSSSNPREAVLDTSEVHIKSEATISGLEDVEVEELEVPMSPKEIKFDVLNEHHEAPEPEDESMDNNWRTRTVCHVKIGRVDYDNTDDDDDDWIAEDNEKDDGEEEYVPKILKKSTSTSAAKKEHNCLQCKKTYKKLPMLQQHVRKCHRSSAEVPDNEKEPNDRAKISSVEPPETYKCARCDSTFAHPRALYAHQRKQHGGYPCPQCERQYKNLESLRTHSFSHLGVRSFVCDFQACDKAFFNKKHLLSHKRIVHVMERNFVCEQCGWHSKQRGALTVHMRSHTGEKPFACKTCGKTFASSSLLIEHKPIHSLERPHVCDVCGAAFSRPKALYHHKFLHSDVKRFVCKICGKAYAQAAGLAGHMRQHRAQQEGVCTL